MEAFSAKLGMAGFARIKLKEDGELVGDSGWIHNVISDRGLDEFLAQQLVESGGEDSVAAVGLGTGGAPATNTSALPGALVDETNARDVPTTNTVTHATAQAVTARWYGTFASSDNHFSTTHAIQNIGLYNSSATNAGSLLSGATFTVSTLNTNQDVEYTYEWRFATTT